MGFARICKFFENLWFSKSYKIGNLSADWANVHQKYLFDETFWLFFVSLEIDACILSPCPVNNLLSCEDLAPPHCGAATDRICHCNVGYTWAGEEQGCVNIDVCTTTVTQWNFDDCGSNTICKDEIGGPISTAGRTCECINDHYKPKCELSCERNYGSFCFFNGLFYLGLTFFFFHNDR